MEMERERVRLLVPYRPVFRSPVLKSSIAGVFCHDGKPIPVYGPLPEEIPSGTKAEERAWILLTDEGARVIQGLPFFLEDAALSAVDGGEAEHAFEASTEDEDTIDPDALLKIA